MKKLLLEDQTHPASTLYENRAETHLTISHTRACWEDMVIQAFREPKEKECWSISPGSGMLSEGYPYEIRWWSLSTAPNRTLDISLSHTLVNRVAREIIGIDLARVELVRQSGIRDPLLAQIALALWQELKQPTDTGKFYARAAAQLLAVHLVRHYLSSSAAAQPTAPAAPQGLTDRQIKHVQEFILTHLSDDLSLDTVAQQIGMSAYHFARLFRKTTGTSLHQVVLRQRIERAQVLLHETDMTLPHIASACGFADQSHLTHVFKRYFGLTPHTYRQQHAGKVFPISASAG